MGELDYEKAMEIVGKEQLRKLQEIEDKKNAWTVKSTWNFTSALGQIIELQHKLGIIFEKKPSEVFLGARDTSVEDGCIVSRTQTLMRSEIANFINDNPNGRIYKILQIDYGNDWLVVVRMQV